MQLLEDIRSLSPRGSRLWFILAALLLFGANQTWLAGADGSIGAGLTLITLAFAALLCGIYFSGHPYDRPRQEWTRRERFIFWSLLLAVLGWHVWHSTSLVRRYHPFIDVLPLQTEAVQALLQGTITHRDIFNAEQTRLFYPSGSVLNGRLLLGFPYPPVCLLLDLPGHLLGDIRYSHIAAFALCALLLARMARGWIDAAIIGFFVLNPHAQLMEVVGWVDTLSLLPLCASVYAAKYRKAWLPIALGIFLYSKQYTLLGVFLVPLLAATAGIPVLRLLWQSLAVAAAIALPFALWNLPHYLHDTLLFQIQSPFRPDSLSFAVLFPIPFAAILLAVLAAVLWTLRLGRRHSALFAAGYALALLVFVAGNKQAFINYYYAAMQALLIAAVALSGPDHRPAQAGGREAESDGVRAMETPAV